MITLPFFYAAAPKLVEFYLRRASVEAESNFTTGF